MTRSERSTQAREKVWVFDLSWLVLPLGFYLLFSWAYETYAPAIGDADLDLLVFEAALLLPVAGFTIFAQKFGVAGWRAPRGLSWLWVAGPLWLGVFTPISAVIETAAGLERILIWLAIALFVAINEETIFRGFILRGLMRSVGPLAAVIASSLAFGLIHFLNLLEGGDPVFVGAQMMMAFGVGAVMAAMTLRSGSIWPAILLHFLADAVGLAALGGYSEAINSAEIAPSLAISGLVFLAWGLFWSWRTVRAGKLAD